MSREWSRDSRGVKSEQVELVECKEGCVKIREC